MTDIRKPYPRRSIPEKSYEEDPDIPDDEYVYCDICLQEYANGCSKHRLKIIRDQKIQFQNLNFDRARSTLPEGLEIRLSGIENAGEGVWSVKLIPSGVRFGPYVGQISKYLRDRSYAWQLKRNGQIFFVDGKDKNKSNWMRYVNCSRNHFERNLIAYQYCGSIYYRTIKPIFPNTELLVYYGSQYAKQLGIDIKNHYYMQSNKFYNCFNCSLEYKTEENLKQHQKRCVYQTVAQVSDVWEDPLVDDSSETSFTSSPPEQVYNCQFCRLSFISSASYENHVKERHVIINIKKKQNEIEFKKKKANQCNYCHKYFAAPYFLNRHLTIHTGKPEYVCLICDAEFSRRYTFIQHQIRHEKNNFYTCSICSKTFLKHSELKHHKKIHTESKEFNCDICLKTFKRIDVMNKHKYTHKEYLENCEE